MLEKFWLGMREYVRRFKKGIISHSNINFTVVKLRAFFNLSFPEYKHMIIYFITFFNCIDQAMDYGGEIEKN